MATEYDQTAAVLTQALRELPDPSPDLRAARVELRRRTRRSVVHRRVLAAAVAATALVVALVTATVLQALPQPDREPPPAKHLKSGLPTGLLKEAPGVVRRGDRSKLALFRLVVRPDGTGMYSPPGFPAHFEGPQWHVRYAGEAPGRVVVLRRDMASCADQTELTLDFTVQRKTVTFTRVEPGPCSAWPSDVRVPPGGITLHVYPDAAQAN